MKPPLGIFLIHICILITIQELHASNDHHPFGEAKTFATLTRNGDHAKLTGDNSTIDEMFLHPEVKDRKVVLFSIIGAYREGKSFFLDYCLRYLYETYPSIRTVGRKLPANNSDWMGDPNQPLTGFSWKHGSKSVTKGALLWNDVFLHDYPNGDKVAIFIVDTQGLFEPHSPEEENSKLFSFSTLLSSIQIINVKETIKENQITHLKSAIDLTKLISSKQKTTTWKPFQTLVFLIRDFDDPDIGTGYLGGDIYLKTVILSEVELDADNTTSMVHLNRKSIRKSFEPISCFVLCHPGSKIKKQGFKGEWGLLDEDFVKNLKNLTEGLLQPGFLVKKAILGKEVTSMQFRNYLLDYLNAFGTYELPKVLTVYEAAVNNQMNEIVLTEYENYKAAVRIDELDYDKTDFISWISEKHEIAKNNSVERFLATEKTKDEEYEEKFRKQLEEKIDKNYKAWSETVIKTYTIKRTEKEITETSTYKVNEYLLKIGLNINYEIENFEAVIDKKSEDLATELIDGFEAYIKMYESIVSTMQYVQNFKKTIYDRQRDWRQGVLKSYSEYKLKQLVNKELEEHQQLANDLKDYSQENFLEYFYDEYNLLKKKILKEFDEEAKVYNDAEPFKSDLSSKIDDRYEAIKTSRYNDYLEFIKLKEEQERGEMKTLVQTEISAYHKELNANIDLDVPNFVDYLKDRHQELIEKAIKNLLEASKKLRKYQNEYREILKNQLQNDFKDWKAKKIPEYEQHQQLKKERIKKEMEALVESYLLKYEKEMNENLVVNDPNFENIIDAKHGNVKGKIIKEFKNNAQDNDRKYEEDLRNKIAATFSDLRRKKITERKVILEREQKTLNKAIEVNIERLINEYKKTMNENIDYGRNDFFNWFNQKHKDTKSKILRNFANDAQVQKSDEKLDHLSNLATKLDAEYEIEIESKTAIYNSLQEDKLKTIKASLDQIVTENYLVYTQGLEGVDHKQKDFELHITQKQEAGKKNALAEYNKALKPEFRDFSETYKNKLSNMIDNNFRSWREKTLTDHRIYLEDLISRTKTEMRTIKRNKITNFKSALQREILSKDQLLSGEFDSILLKIYNRLRNAIISEFKNDVRHFDNESSVRVIQGELENEIDDIFMTWKRSQQVIRKEAMSTDNTRLLTDFIQNLISTYEITMKKNNCKTKNDFFACLENEHSEKSQLALEELEDKYSIVNGKSYNQNEFLNLKNTLMNGIKDRYIDLKKIYTPIERHAIWVRVSTNDRLPDYAVTGGCDRQGPLYIARAKIDNLGWINGKFSPGNKRFYISYRGKEYSFDDYYIEVLTHRNAKWVGYYEGGEKIVGAIKPDGTKYYICKARTFGCEHPGRLDGRICYVAHATEEKEFDKSYEILVLA